MLVALSILPIMGAAALTVDIGRAYLAQARLQGAADGATLAGVGTYGDTEADRRNVARNYFFKAFPSQYWATPAEPQINFNDDQVTLNATAEVDLVFGSFVGMNKIQVAAESQAVADSRAIEVALVLDVTGSMYYNTSGGVRRIEAMRDAAERLTSILFDEAARPDLVNVSVIPYNGTVNIGTGNAAFVSNTDAARYPGTSWAGCVMARGDGHDTRDTYYPSNSADDGGEWEAYRWPVEPNRTGAGGAVNDQCINRADPVGGYLNVIDAITEGSTQQNSRGPNMACPQPILPLTNNRTAIEDRIRALEAVFYGGTITSLGVAWGLRTLSPSLPFSEGAAYNDTSRRKFMVVLTDGEQLLVRQDDCQTANAINGTNYSHSPASEGSWGNTLTTGPATNWTGFGYLEDSNALTSGSYRSALENRLQDVCDEVAAVQDANGAPAITTFTISFGDSSPSETLLRNCATNPDFFFDARSNAALQKAFEDIARSILTSRLTK